jgi:hypothetical protein
MADDKPILTDEERERLLAEDALRRNRRTRYYGKLTQTSSQYEKANIVRGSTFGQIVSERMLRGQGGVSALKGAIGEKIGAVGMGIREKFDPIRLLNKVPILGGALATMYGMKRGRSAADISYFTGAGRFLRQQPTPGELGDVPGQGGTGLASKVGSVLKVENASSSPQKNINNMKTVLGALKKIYALEKMWYDYDKKYRDNELREKQIADSFKEEQDMERHRELIKSLTGKNSKLETKKAQALKKDIDLIPDWIENLAIGAAGGALGPALKNLALKFIPALLAEAAIVSAIGGVVGALSAGALYIPIREQKRKEEAAKKGDVKGVEEAIDKQRGYVAAFGGAPIPYGGDVRDETAVMLKKAAEGGSPQAKAAYEDYIKKNPKSIPKKPKSRFGLLGEKFGIGMIKSPTASKVGGKEGQALEFFQGKGWTPEQASGIVANLKRENSTFDPKLEGDNGQAIGIAQWHSPRQKVFKEVMATDIRDSTFEQQLEFIDWELNNGEYKRAGDKLRQAKTASEAGRIFSMDYEKPADELGEAMKRSDLAEKIHLSMAKPMTQPDALSNRMNVAVSENKNLTSNQQQVAPPIMVNTTNNVIGKGGQSTAMAGPTPVRNDEPMLLRSQYGMVKPV